MAELRRTDLDLRAERAILVQMVPQSHEFDADETFEELASLAQTARAVVVGRLRQKREKPDARTYVGKGKVGELRDLCHAEDANLVITDDELTPAQVRTLEAELDVKVVDRSEVILDIFASHARTKQAKLQVELAQLEYELPRLAGMWVHLDRTAGGTLGGPVGGGIGVRGPGEKQLEVDRRLVGRRVHELRKELAKIEERRHSMVRTRGEQFATVALVGYTNAGKSSVMNALTDAHVSVRDRLFETLDTRTRAWRLSDGRHAMLSDTVGFIRKFPHNLVASFHATLEEAREADMLLHVVDGSKLDVDEEVRAVREVLAALACDHKPTLYLLNKSDVAGGAPGLALIRALAGEVVRTSAVTREGLDAVDAWVRGVLDAGQEEFRVTTPLENGRLESFLHENGRVLESQCLDGVRRYRVCIRPELAGIVRSLGGEIEA